MLAVLVAVLVSLEGTRSELRTTRAEVTEAEQRFQRITEGLGPFVEAAAPLIDRSSRRDLRRAGQSVVDAAGDVPGLADDARSGVGAAIFIAQTLHQADIGGSLARLSAELDRGGSRSLAECDEQLSTAPPSAPGQISCLLAVVPNVRRLLEEQRNINRASLTTQRGTLARTRLTNEQFIESLAIQREILERTRSIDRKLPPSAAPPTG